MAKKSLLFLFATFAVTYGSLCTDLSGTWKNQLNSNMTIESITGNTFTGSYHTAVESTRGASRFTSKISGMIQSAENGKLIAFNVLWNKGASLTAWAGQCIVCDGKEKIFTTWVLRSYLPAKKRWMTTRINQDTFWRIESDNHIEEQGNNENQNTVVETGVSHEGLQGKWNSVTEDSFDIEGIQELGTWNGKVNGNEAVGRFDGNQTYTAMGFVSVAHNKIRGWTGHMDNSEETSELETSWLEHTFHNSCTDPKKHVRFGMDTYAKV